MYPTFFAASCSCSFFFSCSSSFFFSAVSRSSSFFPVGENVGEFLALSESVVEILDLLRCVGAGCGISASDENRVLCVWKWWWNQRICLILIFLVLHQEFSILAHTHTPILRWTTEKGPRRIFSIAMGVIIFVG